MVEKPIPPEKYVELAKKLSGTVEVVSDEKAKNHWSMTTKLHRAGEHSALNKLFNLSQHDARCVTPVTGMEWKVIKDTHHGNEWVLVCASRSERAVNNLGRKISKALGEKSHLLKEVSLDNLFGLRIPAAEFQTLVNERPNIFSDIAHSVLTQHSKGWKESISRA